jgi:ACS family glucarate transporter-like MFS transporter
VRYRVLAWLCVAATIAYVHRNSISVAEGDIRSDLCLTEQEMGWVMSAFYITYAFFQVPTGWLGHVWGTRRALPIFAASWSLATALFGLAGVLATLLALTVSVPAALLAGFLVLLAARLAMGAVQAGIFPCSTLTTALWFPPTGRALPSGALGSFMSVGGAAGAILTGFLLEEIGWRWMFLLYAVPGLVWAAGFWHWFRDRPGEHAEVNAAERSLIGSPATLAAAAAHEPTPWRAILTSPAMGWICGQQFFRAAGYMFFASWFAAYLRATHGVSTREAGVLNSLPLWAVVLGSLVGGALSDVLQTLTGSRRLSRQGLAIVSLMGCASLILASQRVADVRLAVLLISAGSFIASLAAPCAYTITIDMGGRHVAPVFSVMNMAGNVGAILFPLVVPWLKERTGSWDAVLYTFAGVYAAAALCWVMLNPAGTIGQREPREE